MKISRLLLSPLLVITLFSCSMDYSDAEIAEEIGENTPNSIIENFSYTSVDNGDVLFRLYAEKAEIYSTKKETILNKVVFHEYNTENELVTEGAAEKGVIYTESDDAELTGSLIIYSAGNEAEITAEYLYWDDSAKSLIGSDNGNVKLLKDSGTEISGAGFYGDLRTKIFSFDKNVNGIYHYEED